MRESRTERKETNDEKSQGEERYKCLCSIINHCKYSRLKHTFAGHCIRDFFLLRTGVFCPARERYVYVWSSGRIKPWGMIRGRIERLTWSAEERQGVCKNGGLWLRPNGNCSNREIVERTRGWWKTAYHIWGDWQAATFCLIYYLFFSSGKSKAPSPVTFLN